MWVMNELRSPQKKILEQLELTLAHKEGMKDKELEKEQIKYDKTKGSPRSTTLACTKHRYKKAKKVNFD